MNSEIIFKLIAAAMAALPALIEAGVNVYDRVKQIQKLAEDAAKGTVTQTQVDDVRTQLDRDLDEFNSPLPTE
jgi:hypothetical protein